MQDDGSTELHLSEEQLQAITGGCADCSKNLRLAVRYARISKGHGNLAKIAKETNMPTHIIEDHIRDGRDALRTAQFFKDRVKAIRETPGHNP